MSCLKRFGGPDDDHEVYRELSVEPDFNVDFVSNHPENTLRLLMSSSLR